MMGHPRNCRRLMSFGLLTLFVIVGCEAKAPPVPGAGGTVTPPKPAGGAVRRIIVLTNGNSPFWDACKAGIVDAEKELKLAEAGLTALMEVNDGTVAGQLNKLRQYGTQSDVVGVAISAIDGENVNVSDELKNLKKKGIGVVTIDSDMERKKFRSSRTAFIGTDNFQGGKELGRCAAQLLPDGGEYVTFVGLASAQNAKERINGFADGAGAKFKSADAMSDDFDPTRARENVRNAMSNHKQLNALVGIYSYNAPAIVDVVKERNKRDAFKIFTFDAEPIAIKDMGAGQIDAMVVQNPYQMGYQSVRLLKALITDDAETQKAMLPKLGEPEGDIYDTGLKVVVPDEKSPIKKDSFGERTEFLTLDAFREWLKKYNLTGS